MMTSRSRMTAIMLDASPADLVALIASLQQTRYPGLRDLAR